MPFLLLLGIGIAVGLVAGATVLDTLLVEQPVALMAVLLGLVAASVPRPARVPKWTPLDISVAALATAAAWLVATSPAGSAPTQWWFLPIAGAIAAAAMILPGISGSFLLLLMGLYEPIIHAVAVFDLAVIGLVGIGAAAGLLSFSRGLRTLLRSRRGTTHAAMVGLLLGSLVKLWPWRSAPGFAAGNPVAPDGFAPLAWLLLGAAVGLLLDRAGRPRQKA